MDREADGLSEPSGQDLPLRGSRDRQLARNRRRPSCRAGQRVEGYRRAACRAGRPPARQGRAALGWWCSTRRFCFLPFKKTCLSSVPRAKERVEYLIDTLSKAGEKIVIPTPALSECLGHAAQGVRKLTRLVNAIDGRSIDEIMGHPDDLKFHSCMTLFVPSEPGPIRVFKATVPSNHIFAEKSRGYTV